MGRLLKNSDNQILASEVIEARSFSERLIGLMGKKSWPKEKTLWIHECPSIHTFFCRFPIDVVFVDENLKVVKVIQNIKPWRMTGHYFKASSVFEFASTNKLLEGLKPGDQLHVGG